MCVGAAGAAVQALEVLGLDRQGLSAPAQRVLRAALPAACHLEAV